VFDIYCNRNVCTISISQYKSRRGDLSATNTSVISIRLYVKHHRLLLTQLDTVKVK
jgi:hypothetical protein